MNEYSTEYSIEFLLHFTSELLRPSIYECIKLNDCKW